MDSVQEMRADLSAPQRQDDVGIQSVGYLLELSLDWIVLRASENIHHLLGQSHVTLIDEPLGRFVHAQALHDLRNLFSRLSGTTGITRAYGVRLTDEPDLVDIAFQLSDGRVLLEAIPCADGHFGECFGTIGGLIAGLGTSSGQALLDGAARRMRALTGYDRVTLFYGNRRAESSRSKFAQSAEPLTGPPAVIADRDGSGVPIFPREADDMSAAQALLRRAEPALSDRLRAEGVAAMMRVPFTRGNIAGEFRCDHRAPHSPSLELHAAAELFAQFFALQLEIDRLKNGAD